MSLLTQKLLTAMKRHVRQGFLIAVVIGTSIVGSTLWAAIAMMPHFQTIHPQSGLPSLAPLLASRMGITPELAWFFMKYSYLSQNFRIRKKNYHTFIVEDGPRGREYVVTVGQNTRRVEIYFGGDASRTTIHIYSPGKKRAVELTNNWVTRDETTTDANLWMWQGPLWNSLHFKIYALADFWLDSPYKKYSCAGFVHKFLRDAGVNVPIRDAWDLAKLPYMRVPVDEMEPGDIITIRAASERHRRFWKHQITHVGVYLGNGKLIHASTASMKARRSYIRVATLEQFRGRIDKILRPPDCL